MSPIEKVLVPKLMQFAGSVPNSHYQKRPDPEREARHIISVAAKKAAAVSGAAAMVPGIGTTLTLIPDLLATIAVQRQMVADIAAVYGHKDKLKPEVQTSLIFGDVAPGAVKGLVRPGGSRFDFRDVSHRVMRRIIRSIAMSLARRLAGRWVERLVPMVGAAGAGFGSYKATQVIGESAIEFFTAKKIGVPAPIPDKVAP